MLGTKDPPQGRLRPDFSVWMRFLSDTKQTPENREMLREYFLLQFTKSPQLLDAFVQHLHAFMKTGSRAGKHERVATEYLENISPLCEHFGLFTEKLTLDTLAFRIVEPVQYRTVELLLLGLQKKSQRVIAAIKKTLTGLMAENKHPCHIEGRYKSLYSIYRKLERKGYETPLQLRDIFAFRIILESNVTDECFDVVNLLHDQFLPMAACFKDYITIPKVNGYQSLHTVLNNVVEDLDLPIEVQIRTRAMHEVAENGLASHWMYARKNKTAPLTEKELRLLSHFASLSEAAAAEKTFYCFSPKGDLVQLHSGATGIDFAYQIHTEIGNRAKELRINGRKRSLLTTLRDGDRVEVLTAPVAQVKRGWLAFAGLPSTRRKIYENAAE